VQRFSCSWPCRAVTLNDANNNNLYDAGENFGNAQLSNLDLFLMPAGANNADAQNIWSSVSNAYNVETMFFQLPAAAGNAPYEIWVRQTNNVAATYALAWWAEAAPGNPPVDARRIGDKVWNDANANGLQELGEAGVPNVTVQLYSAAGSLLDTITTDYYGEYQFEVAPGDYYIKVVAPYGMTFTTKDYGNNQFDNEDSDADTVTGQTNMFTIGAYDDFTIDAGLVSLPYGSIGDTVWKDLDEDGIQDPGEPGMPDVAVELYTVGGDYFGAAITDLTGQYQFTNVAPGDYYLTFMAPPNYKFSPKDEGANDALDSDADTTGQTADFVLAMSENKTSLDAGLILAGGTIGDYVWFDDDQDGTQGGEEYGIPFVAVDLFTSTGTLVATTSTDESGYYAFTTVAPGDYYIVVEAPYGYSFTTPNVGTDDSLDSDANASGQTSVFTVTLGEDNTTIDAGLRPVLVSINDVTLSEGNSGSKAFNFTVSLSAPSSETVTVDYGTADDTATTADNDYVATSGTVTFEPGETSKTVTVNVTGDTKFEQNDTFVVVLVGATYAFIEDNEAVGTILNDDPLPGIKINDVSLAEGQSGTTPFTFAVTLTNPSYQTITVNYATADNSATIADNDYTAASGTVTFNPGETTKSITVLVNGDTKHELDEKFLISLSSATNALVQDNTGVGTILNDDQKPRMSITNVVLAEGDSATTPFTFTVSLSNPSYQTITVHYETADNSAISTSAAKDYVAKIGNLTFQPGQTSKTITIAVKGDTTFEPSERFFVDLSSPSNAVLLDDRGAGHIVNDDGQPTITITDVTRVEGNSGTTAFTFAVRLSHPSVKTVTVQYATANGTATAASGDYLSRSGTLTFQPGQLSKGISVPVVGNTVSEPNETFFVNLSNPSFAALLDNQGQGTIIDDDVATPGVLISDVSQAEGNIGTTVFWFQLGLTAPSSQQVTVQYTTANGSAAAPGDYASTTSSVTFQAGQTTQWIPVSVVGDTNAEPDETFLVNLTSATNATIKVAQAQGTIENDDAAPPDSVISILDAPSLTEGNSGTMIRVFAVWRTDVSSQATVNYSTSNGSATAPSDYTATSGTLTFNVGEPGQSISVPILGDTFQEDDEWFTVNLFNATGAVIGEGQATATILNATGSRS